jgi:hypothetical protein
MDPVLEHARACAECRPALVRHRRAVLIYAWGHGVARVMPPIVPAWLCAAGRRVYLAWLCSEAEDVCGAVSA